MTDHISQDKVIRLIKSVTTRTRIANEDEITIRCSKKDLVGKINQLIETEATRREAVVKKKARSDGMYELVGMLSIAGLPLSSAQSVRISRYMIDEGLDVLHVWR